MVAEVIAHLRQTKSSTSPGNSAIELGAILLVDIKKQLKKIAADCAALKSLSSFCCKPRARLSPVLTEVV